MCFAYIGVNLAIVESIHRFFNGKRQTANGKRQIGAQRKPRHLGTAKVADRSELRIVRNLN
jgi:ribosomal protein L44E